MRQVPDFEDDGRRGFCVHCGGPGETDDHMPSKVLVGDAAFGEGWLLVQKDRYRYRVLQDDGLRVKIVIREYLAAEIRWD